MKPLFLSLAQTALRRLLSVSAFQWREIRARARWHDDTPGLTPQQRHNLLDGELARILPVPEPVRRRIIQAAVLANRLEELAAA